MEADLRRLLRRSRDPFRLAAFPLAETLCDVTGIANPQAALRHVIDQAFQEDWQDSRLRELLMPNAARPLQISTRHFQRRRAKAVAILALHVRKLVGPLRPAATEDRASAHVDPLATMAEIVSDIEPGTAASIYRLGGPQSAARADMMTIRACVDIGAEIQTAPLSPLVAVLRAQSKQLNGKPDEAKHELWPIFARAARDRDRDSEVKFELEWLAFLRARQGGSARLIYRVATNLERIAQGNPHWAGRALLAQAEARIRCGRLQDAVALLEEADQRSVRNFAFRQLASSSVLQAEIALQRGDDALAETLAAGAYMILRGRHCDAYRSQTVLARARLRLGKPWGCPGDLGSLSSTAWDSVAVLIECARHFSLRGGTERARKAATQAYETAVTLQYDGLAARGAAALGLTFDKTPPQRRDWYLRALSHLLVARDRSVGCDLFTPDAFPEFDEAISDVLYAGLLNAIPQLRADAQSESDAARAFLKHLSAFVLGFIPYTEELGDAIEALGSRARSFAKYVLYFFDDATDVMDVAFAATVGSSRRAEMDQRLGIALRSFGNAVQPRGNPREFLVG